MRLELPEARALVEASIAMAADLGKAVTVAVVDAGGYLVTLDRMDGARPLTPSIALAKAYSAAVMQRPTSMLRGWSESDPVFFSQVARMGHQPVVATSGGFTLKRGDVFLGGLGVAGASADEDEQICVGVVRAAGFDMTFPQWAGSRPAVDPASTSTEPGASHG
jgi:uncharacterized protein GlcG (DUF336 family)